MHNNESIHVTTGGLPAAPLTVWKCDTCGDNINQPGKALVVWRTTMTTVTTTSGSCTWT